MVLIDQRLQIIEIRRKLKINILTVCNHLLALYEFILTFFRTISQNTTNNKNIPYTLKSFLFSVYTLADFEIISYNKTSKKEFRGAD